MMTQSLRGKFHQNQVFAVNVEAADFWVPVNRAVSHTRLSDVLSYTLIRNSLCHFIKGVVPTVI